jgi:hypothetical protein
MFWIVQLLQNFLHIVSRLTLNGFDVDANFFWGATAPDQFEFETREPDI